MINDPHGYSLKPEEKIALRQKLTISYKANGLPDYEWSNGDEETELILKADGTRNRQGFNEVPKVLSVFCFIELHELPPIFSKL